MIGFLARRIVVGTVVLAGVSIGSFCFFASRTDPYRGHPLLPQYWTWFRGIWDGSSLHPLGGSVFAALERTSMLLGFALVLVTAIVLALAIVAACFRGSMLDLVLRAFAYLAWGTPAFLLALLIQQLLNVNGSGHGLGPFPIAGWPGSCPAGLGIDAGTIRPCPAAGSGVTHALNILRYLTFPALTLALAFVGYHARQLRSALVDTLGLPYIVTARAKGLSETRVVVRHALRVSLIPFAAGLLSDFGAIFGAALAVDFIFKLGGLGSVFIGLFPQGGPASLDVYALQLILVLTAAIVILSSLLAELAVVVLDPRIRAQP
jgi:ABC-type dipeptide/oligopeptide/nickel transport system permease component